MTNPIKYVLSHEPALAGGVTLAAGVFSTLHFTGGVNGDIQGTVTAIIALASGFLSRFTTSPATQAKVQTGITDLPKIATDAENAVAAVEEIKAALKDPQADSAGIFDTIRRFVDDHVNGHLTAWDQKVDDSFEALNKGARDAVTQVREVAATAIAPKPTPAAPITPTIVPNVAVTPPAPAVHTIAPVTVDPFAAGIAAADAGVAAS